MAHHVDAATVQALFLTEHFERQMAALKKMTSTIMTSKVQEMIAHNDRQAAKVLSMGSADMTADVEPPLAIPAANMDVVEDRIASVRTGATTSMTFKEDLIPTSVRKFERFTADAVSVIPRKAGAATTWEDSPTDFVDLVERVSRKAIRHDREMLRERPGAVVSRVE